MNGSNPDAVVTRRVALLVVDGVSMLDVAAPSEVFAESRHSSRNYDLVVCSPDGKNVTTGSGLPLQADSNAHDEGPLDTVIITGGCSLPNRTLAPEHISAARHLASRARRVASVCTGAFVLGAAGLLDGRKATTHWHHTQRLQELYPRAEIIHDSELVSDGNLITSAGEGAGIALTLQLLKDDQGEKVRSVVARDLVVYQPQSAEPADEAATAPRNPVVRKLTEEIVADPSAQYTLTDLAVRAAVSPRHLSRLFQEELQITPAKFVEQVRFDTARSLLDRGASVTDTAFMSGFGSMETLRRAFIARLGVSPRAYQHRFKTA
ncbi:DJ-1/PfpI family protein [Streptomyces sp. MC1]|uniref:GlxA family transcriptional regulator n=1 Tax=Streptomyces sp. MC1 TaxID=295105 RepID=UPI0018CA1F4E|nr:DJ-1/PfpI family protein [Streptomyces sp. MC1]MBG7702523.1 DJ-1/PfpI family protein [Streptomyces sp. MC1]